MSAIENSFGWNSLYCGLKSGMLAEWFV